jgi:alkylated DNA repair dioxygenase AlkB
VPELRRVWLDPESWIDLCDDYLDAGEADEFLAWSLDNIDWEERGEGRLLAWYGTFDYEYPGVSHPARPIPTMLSDLCQRVAKSYPEEAPYGFDGIRLNRYNTYHSFIDFHTDSEPSLASAYPIAFVSVGHPRVLLVRAASPSVHPGYAFTLGHGNLVVMGGETQAKWLHAIPVEPQRDDLRVSITLRKGVHDLPRLSNQENQDGRSA